MRRLLFPCVLVGGMWFACACSGGSTEEGKASVVLTDMATDELDTFQVDVTGIRLHKLSGSTVSVPAGPSPVDFATLEDLGELVAGFTLPAGVYTGITLTLDFANAVVVIKDKTTPATVVDSNGTALTGTLEVQVDFATANQPEVVVGKHHMFLIDLDLDQAITVDAANNKVTFEPVLSARMDPTNPKPTTAQGFLTAVDVGLRTFTIERRTRTGAPVARLHVQAAAGTVYQIDGIVSFGTAGITALSQLNLDTTYVFVWGLLNPVQRRLDAVVVESGAGTFGNGQDWLIGTITARSGTAGNDATLTVHGRSRQFSTGSRTFNTTHTVNVAFGTTKVLRRFAGNSLSTDALNVGQFVIAFGSLAGTTLDASSATGVVRMVQTSVYGTANQAPVGNTLTLNVTRIGLRPISAFDFKVGTAQEADPSAYTVDITGLSSTGITTGSKIRAVGFVNPVGVTTDDNLDAVTIVNRSVEAKLLWCGWSPASTSAITSANSTAVTLDVSGAASKGVYDGFTTLHLNTSPAPRIMPRGLLGIYRIVEGNSVELHLLFSAFAASLDHRLTANAPFSRVAALGTFDTAAQEFRANVVTVIVH